MKRKSLLAGWASLTVGLLVLATALVWGVLVAGPAQAASLGTVQLSQTSGTVDANPMFASATTSTPCPATFGEEAALRIGPATGSPGDFDTLAPALGGGGYDQAPVTINPTRSFSTAISAAPADGSWLIIVNCYSLTESANADRFETPITVCGNQWFVGTTCDTEKTPTTTTLAVDPEGPVDDGTAVTLGASVDPPGATGTVQFHRSTNNGNDVADIGDPVTVSGGTASLPATVLPIGVHQLTAIFTPTGDTFAPSTSSEVRFEVTAAGDAATPVLTLTADPPAPQAQGAQVTFTATIDPVEATGKVLFRGHVGTGQTTDIQTVDLTAGVATLSVSDLPVGRNSIDAIYQPDNDGFKSVSQNLEYQITGEGGGGAPTTTTLAVTPAGAQPIGSTLTLTATVDPATAGGQVQFLDGTAPIGSAAVSGGQAIFAAGGLAVGTHTLKASFTSSDPDTFANSESTVVSVEITGEDDGGGGDDDGGGEGNGDDNGGGSGDSNGNGNGGDNNGGGGSLAKTGAALTTMAASGVVLVGVGAGAVALSRRRRLVPQPAVSWPDLGAGPDDEEAE